MVCIRLGVMRERRRPRAVLSASHQAADPTNTPATSQHPAATPPEVPSPNAANTAANERIVAGLANVRRKVEAQAPRSPVGRASPGDSWAGGLRNVRTP